MMKGTPKCLRGPEPRRPVTNQHFTDWFVWLLLTTNRLTPYGPVVTFCRLPQGLTFQNSAHKVYLCDEHGF